MALAQYNYPQPTGLQQIGDVLLKGSGDYANIQLQRQQEERRRAQQLADLQDQRRFAVEQRGVERGLALEDEARRRKQALQDVTVATLVKEGWLKPTDADNPRAVKEAADARQVRVGAGLEREGQLPARFQEEADYLGKQDVELAAIEAQLNAQLSAPAPSAPSQQEVRQYAIRSLRTPERPIPTDAEITAALPAAADAIAQDRYMRWSMAKEDAKTQIQLLRTQRTALRQSLGALLQQGFTPSRPPPPTQTLSAPGAALRPASAAEAAAAAGGAVPPPVPAPTPSAPPPPSVASFQDPSLAPATSIKGIGQRLPELLPEFLAVPGRAIDTGTRYAAAGLRGLWEGDFSVPQQGPVALAGQEIGRRLAPPIVPGDYMSAARAQLLGLPRSLDPLPPLKQLATGTPSSVFLREPGF